MQYIEYWEVTEDFDRSSTHVASFKSKADADALKGKSMYRSVGRRNIIIFESLQDYEENNKAKIRKRAIAKLTPEEREVLGIRA